MVTTAVITVATTVMNMVPVYQIQLVIIFWRMVNPLHRLYAVEDFIGEGDSELLRQSVSFGWNQYIEDDTLGDPVIRSTYHLTVASCPL